MTRKLLLLAGLAAAACHRPANSAADEAAIKQVLAKEAATWRAGDVAGHAACWQVRPYSRILVSTAEGRLLDVPPSLMVQGSPAMGQGGTAVQSGYQLHVAGSDAWVTHDEVSTTKDGQKSYSRELRLLEKVAGQWKLVGQSIHVYKP